MYLRFVTLFQTTFKVEISIGWNVHICSFEVGSSYINAVKVQPTKLYQFQFQSTIIRRVIQFSLWMRWNRKPLDIEHNWILSSANLWHRNGKRNRESKRRMHCAKWSNHYYRPAAIRWNRILKFSYVCLWAVIQCPCSPWRKCHFLIYFLTIVCSCPCLC